MNGFTKTRTLLLLAMLLWVLGVSGTSVMASQYTHAMQHDNGSLSAFSELGTLHLDFSLSDLDYATTETIRDFLELNRATLPSDVQGYILTVQYAGESGIQYLAFVPTDVYFSHWRLPLPEEHIIRLILTKDGDREVVQFLPSVGVQPSLQTLDYRFPWTNGVAWAKTQGYHFNTMGFSLDFAPGTANPNVLAIESGVLRSVCLDPYQAMVKIEHPGGPQSGYLHLTRSTVPTAKFNTTIPRGEILGTAYAGSAIDNPHPACIPTTPYKFATACGCGTGTHLHFETNQKLTIQGFSMDSISSAANGTLYTSTNGASANPNVTVAPALTPAYNGSTCGCGWYKIADGFYLTLNTNNPAESTNSAVWRPNLPTSGRWKVEALIANHPVITWPCAPVAGRVISWDTSDARYTVYHRDGTTAVTGNQRPLTDQWLNLGEFNFNAGTTGYIKLVDLNGETNLTYSVSFNVVRFTLVTAVPAAPTSLSATAASTTQINLTWVDASNNESGFKIERSANGTSGWAQIGTVGANVTTYNSTGLTCGTPYYYRVRSYNTAGNSAYSNTANATTSACPPAIPAAPTNLSATAASAMQINLTWTDASNNETGFKIERSANGANGWVEIATVGANVTVYSNTELTCGTPYYYRVRSYNTAGNSAYSNMANATTSACPPTIPAAPTNLSAAAVSTTQINLTWTDASSNESGFKIERSENGTSDWAEIGTVSANVAGYNNTGLTSGTPYYYRVRAYNAAGNSTYSNIANATTWSDNAASVYLSPMPATVAPNTQFTLTLNIANTANLGAHEQTFTFDPAVFTVTRVLPGNFLSSTGRTLVFMPPLIDNSAGEVSLGAYSQSSATPPLPGPNGGGILAYVVGRASASGTADLHFTQNRITDIAGAILPASAQDGSVTIIACLGDFDGNGEVGINDIQTIANLWRVRQGDVRYDVRFDINGNGEIDISDIQTVANRWKKPCTATTQHSNTIAATRTTAMLWLDPPLVTAPAGQTFTVQLSISDAVNLGAFETAFNYDPAVLEFVSATVGGFLGSTGRTVTFLPPQVDPVAGRVDLGAYTLAPPDAGADGNGVLVNVTLRALEPGSSNLTLTSAQITTPAGTTQDLTTQISIVQIYTAHKVYLPLVVRDKSQ
ncbi:MAG: fibronectin type III domain-containing protein [Anaerolineae bacterium]|nr:fibronectin type III domain-containing protein [Anaerolineae bacterium]